MRLILLVEQDIAWLQIAMEYPALVGVVDGAGYSIAI
jgi:hypothetical protein